MGISSEQGHYVALVAHQIRRNVFYHYSDQIVNTWDAARVQAASGDMTQVLIEFDVVPEVAPLLILSESSDYKRVEVDEPSASSSPPSGSTSSSSSSSAVETIPSASSNSGEPETDVPVCPDYEAKAVERPSVASEPVLAAVIPTDVGDAEAAVVCSSALKRKLPSETSTSPLIDPDADSNLNFDVTRLRRKDVEQVLKLRTLMPLRYTAFSEAFPGLLKTEINSKMLKVLVIKRSQEVLGYLYYIRAGRLRVIRELVVDTAFQRCGLAIRLIQHFKACAHIRRIEVELFADDLIDRLLFVRTGFSVSIPSTTPERVVLTWVSHSLRCSGTNLTSTHFANTGGSSNEVRGGSLHDLHFSGVASRLVTQGECVVANTNVRSLRNALKKGVLFFEKMRNIDLLVLTEVQAPFAKLETNERFKQAVSKYPVCFWNGCNRPARSSGYSGVGVCCKVMPQKVLFDFMGDDPTLSEGRIITLFFLDVVAVCVYSPASKTDDDCVRREFDYKLIEHVVQLRASHKLPVLVVGDLNVPPSSEDISENPNWVLQPRNYEQERARFQQLLKSGRLCDTTAKSGFTWYPEPHIRNQLAKQGQRLDLTLSPEGWTVVDCNVHHLDHFSDHRPVVLTFQVGPVVEIGFGLRRVSELTAGLDLSLFQNSSLVVGADFKSIVRTCVDCHTQLQLEDALAHDKFVPLWNGPKQKPHHALVYPEDSDEEDDDDVPVSAPAEPDNPAAFFSPAYHALLRDDGFNVSPKFSEYFLARNAVDPKADEPKFKMPTIVPSCARVKLAAQVVFHTVLLDTGCDLCLIDDAFARKAVQAFDTLFVKWTRNLVLGDGASRMVITGYIPLLIQFMTSTGTLVSAIQLFFCVSLLRDCLIIGDVFYHTDQKHHGADLSPSKRTMTLKGQTIPYAFRLKHVHLAAPRVIHIAGKATIEVTFPLNETFDGITGHVFDKLAISDVLVRLHGTPEVRGHIAVRLINLSSSTRVLKAGETIGCFQQFDDGCHIFEDESKEVRFKAMSRISKSDTYQAVSERLGFVMTVMNKPVREPGFQGSLTPGKSGGLQCALECDTTLAADNSYRSPPAALGVSVINIRKDHGVHLGQAGIDDVTVINIRKDHGLHLGQAGIDDVPLVIVGPLFRPSSPNVTRTSLVSLENSVWVVGQSSCVTGEVLTELKGNAMNIIVSDTLLDESQTVRTNEELPLSDIAPQTLVAPVCPGGA